MKILHINTRDVSGGAARAMFRLHNGLLKLGHDSKIIAGFPTSKDSRIYSLREITRDFENIIEKGIEKISTPIDIYLGLAHWLYPSSFHICQTEIFRDADVINLHNLHSNYFNYKALPMLTQNKPTVWTLHDMWPLTGHCSYSYDCQRWVSRCFDCPLLKGDISTLRRCEPRPIIIDISKAVWRLKRDIYRRSFLNIVTPSEWLYNKTRNGAFGKTTNFQHIPNGIDIDLFKPQDKIRAREMLDLPPDDFILLFPSEAVTQHRKGYRYLLSAIKELKAPVSLMVFGRKGVPPDLRPAARFLETGYVDSEELLSKYYAVSDLVIVPTLADNQPLVIVEAMACGKPVVAFDAGGVGEMVRHMETGYKAVYKDAKDLARGINILRQDSELYLKLSRRCREIATEEYSLQLQADRYLAFYEKVISEFKNRKES